MFELKSLTYEEARAEHFKGLMKKMQRKIDWWQNKERNALGPVSMLSRSHLECTEAGMLYSYYNDALEALENQPKWISVEERLPVGCDFYLTYSRKCGIMVLIFYPERKTWVNGETGESEIKVTHWMSLPERPKEDA